MKRGQAISVQPTLTKEPRSFSCGPYLLCLAVLFSGTFLLGQTTQKEANKEKKTSQQNLLDGDWNGMRAEMRRHGIELVSRYVAESATVYAGGTGQGSDFSDDIAFGFDANLQRLVGWKGATFHFNFSRRHGGSASANFLGNNILTVQENNGAGETNRLTELSIDQSLFDKHVNVKAGYFIMGNDFARTSVLCDFENLGFCAHAESLPNDAAWADWPTGQLGARFRYNFGPKIYAEVAAFEANANNKKFANGFNLGFEGATGVIFPVEFSWTKLSGVKALPGHYKLGGYYDSSEAKDQDLSGRKVAGRYGGWLLGDQRVWSFEPGTPRGLTVFAQGTLSDKMTSPMSSYLLGAMIVQGPMKRRAEDYINFGCVHAGVNPRALRAESMQALASKAIDTTFANAEIDCEAGYGWQITHSILIHPNFQYVRNPSAFSFGHVANGWVFGTMTKIVF